MGAIAMLWGIALVVSFVGYRLMQAGIEALPVDRSTVGYAVIVFCAVVQAGFSLLNAAVYVTLREENGGMPDNAIEKVFE